jgi:hypothetical protein
VPVIFIQHESTVGYLVHGSDVPPFSVALGFGVRGLI